MSSRDAGDPLPSDDTDVSVSVDRIPLHSTNLLTVLDEDGTVRYESPSIERIFGFEPDELVGEPVAEYFHPDDRQRVIQAFERVVESDEFTVEAVEFRHERADGSYVWVESVASANPTPEGFYVINTRDVSERKARERELERTNARLEEFAAVLSHDLRNPLTVAAGRLDLARQEAESEHFDAIDRALDRMNELIDDVFVLAQLGDTVGDTEPVKLSELAETCWQAVDPGEASMVFETDHVIQADAAQLRRLLENLFKNAVVHGGEEVRIVVGDLDDGFYVEDDGPGIPDSERTAVVKPGYSTHPEGTGFGLAIVRDIAEAHGWTLAITESADGGARFEFSGVELA